MSAAQLLAEVAAAGGQVTLTAAGSLDLRAPKPLPKPLIDRLKAQKPTVAAYLANQPGSYAGYVNYLWDRVFDRYTELWGPKSWWQLWSDQNLDGPPPFELLQLLTTDSPPDRPPNPRPVLEFRVRSQQARKEAS